MVDFLWQERLRRIAFDELPNQQLVFKGHLALHLGYWLSTSLATIWYLEVIWPSTWGTGLVPAWPPFGI
jgi:hypothetical protein